MARHRQKWNIGDTFLIRASDGLFSVGQIVGREARVLNSVSVALFSNRHQNEAEAKSYLPEQSDIISVIFTTRDLLDNEEWKVVGHRAVAVPVDLLPYEDLRASNFVGAKVYGSGNVESFLEAFHQLAPWDAFHDPDYLDRLLLSPDKKPKNLILTGKST